MKETVMKSACVAAALMAAGGFQRLQVMETLSCLTDISGPRLTDSPKGLYERIQPGDMTKSSVIIASFVYHTANRDGRLPRKTLSKPRHPRPTTTR